MRAIMLASYEMLVRITVQLIIEKPLKEQHRKVQFLKHETLPAPSKKKTSDTL